MNEFELIERYFRRAPRNADVRIGIGDDGAVFAPAPGMEYVVTVDMLVRSGGVDIIVIDSVAALVPKAEIEGEMGATTGNE